MSEVIYHHHLLDLEAMYGNIWIARVIATGITILGY